MEGACSKPAPAILSCIVSWQQSWLFRSVPLFPSAIAFVTLSFSDKLPALPLQLLGHVLAGCRFFRVVCLAG